MIRRVIGTAVLAPFAAALVFVILIAWAGVQVAEILAGWARGRPIEWFNPITAKIGVTVKEGHTVAGVAGGQRVWLDEITDVRMLREQGHVW